MEHFFISEKEQNRYRILANIMQASEISATEVSQQTNLSPATVSRVFKELRDKKIVQFVRKDKTDKGRNPDLYSFNWEYGFLIHYYIINDKVTGYLADLSGKVLKKVSFGLSPKDTLDDFFSIIRDIKAQLVQQIQNKEGNLLAAGFSIPGVVNEESRSVYSIPDVEQLDNIKFFDYAERILGVPVIANNVSWLSAVGEKTHYYPFANSLVYIVFTHYFGIGAGIIYKNELIKGSMHYAGEIGQSWFNRCYSLDEYIEGKGLFEHTASLRHLYASAEKLLSENKAPILKKIMEETDGESCELSMLEKAAEAGDEDIKALLEEAIGEWAGMIININFILNPEFIVLGGCISSENRYIFNLLNNSFKKIKMFQPSLQLSNSGEDAQLFGGLQMLIQYANDEIIFEKALK
jgi:predicted NBD/HSP70 family sugar kinase